jgi:hypothetical protein
MQLLAYQGCIKPQLWAIKLVGPLKTFAIMRLPKGVPLVADKIDAPM